MKTTLILTLLGALLGVVIASYIVPPWLSRYTPPAGLPEGTQIQSLVQTTEVIRHSTSKLMRGQLIGGCIGAVVGLGVGIMLMVRARKSKAEAIVRTPGSPSPV